MSGELQEQLLLIKEEITQDLIRTSYPTLVNSFLIKIKIIRYNESCRLHRLVYICRAQIHGSASRQILCLPAAGQAFSRISALAVKAKNA